MKFCEFLDKEALGLVIRRLSNEKPCFRADIDGAYVFDGKKGIFFFGRGDTPEEAMLDYAKQIEGRTLNCYDSVFIRSVVVPDSLTM